MAIDTVPSCVQHGVAAADGTVKPYEHCAAFYTFASNQTFDAKTTSEFWLGASNGTLLLVALGIIVMVAALVAWVVTEDAKLLAQARRLRAAQAGTPPPPPASAAAGVTPDV
jgi:hypothetical protein